MSFLKNLRIIVENPKPVVFHHCIMNVVVAICVGVGGEAQRICCLGVETEGSDETSSYHISNTPITGERTEFPVRHW